MILTTYNHEPDNLPIFKIIFKSSTPINTRSIWWQIARGRRKSSLRISFKQFRSRRACTHRYPSPSINRILRIRRITDVVIESVATSEGPHPSNRDSQKYLGKSGRAPATWQSLSGARAGKKREDGKRGMYNRLRGSRIICRDLAIYSSPLL